MTARSSWPRIPNRRAVMLSQRPGESLRDTELRWQAKADPMIAEQFAAGRSKREIADEIGTSRGGVLNALRRFEMRNGQGKEGSIEGGASLRRGEGCLLAEDAERRNGVNISQPSDLDSLPTCPACGSRRPLSGEKGR